MCNRWDVSNGVIMYRMGNTYLFHAITATALSAATTILSLLNSPIISKSISTSQIEKRLLL